MKKMQTAFAEKESEWRDQMTILKRELVAKDKKVQVTSFKLCSALWIRGKTAYPLQMFEKLGNKNYKKAGKFSQPINSSL
jgi:hypothetical protein